VPDRASHTVEDYMQDAQLRHGTLAHCANDPGSVGSSPDCVNAREADRKLGVGNLRDLPTLRLPGTKK
jgi:hypothetical protein